MNELIYAIPFAVALFGLAWAMRKPNKSKRKEKL